MWCASAKFIKEYEKCVEEWFNKNKDKHNAYGETLIINLCKEINKNK